MANFSNPGIMKNTRLTHQLLNYAISLVWFVNGLICKVLNIVPRHQQIVTRILGEEHAALFTKLIGIAEIIMGLWILSNFKSRLCAVTQICIVGLMNIIEFFLAEDLLLFGKMNSMVAIFFMTVVYYNEFVLNKKEIRRQ